MKRKKAKMQVYVGFDITTELKKDGSLDSEALKDHVYECLHAMIRDDQIENRQHFRFSVVPYDQELIQNWKH